jgi:hypothetical protein
MPSAGFVSAAATGASICGSVATGSVLLSSELQALNSNIEKIRIIWRLIMAPRLHHATYTTLPLFDNESQQSIAPAAE